MWCPEPGEERPCSFCTLSGHLLLEPRDHGGRKARPQGEATEVLQAASAAGCQLTASEDCKVTPAQPLTRYSCMGNRKWEPAPRAQAACRTMRDHGNTCLVLLYATKFWVGCYAAIDNWYRSLLPALVTWTKRELWTTGLHEFHPNIYFCTLFTYCLGEQEETLALEGPSRKIASRHL